MTTSPYEASPQDSAVAEAMGIGGEVDQQQVTEPEEQEQGEERTLAEADAELAEVRREVARLKRENAEARVKAKKVSPQSEGQPTTADLTAAEERGREAARLEYGVKLAAARITAALTGIVPESQLEATVDDLNLSRYLDEGGEVDAEAVKALVARQRVVAGRSGRSSVGHSRSGRPDAAKSPADQFAEFMSGQLH